MKSTTVLKALFGSLTNNSATVNTTLGLQLMNDSIRRIAAERDWDFMQKAVTASTVASQQFYNLPYDYHQLIDVTVLTGTNRYVPVEVPNREAWDLLNQQSSYTSDIPQYYFIFNGQIGFWPTPSSNGSSNITYNYLRRIIDLSVEDYTTGTISQATNGSTTITGSGTTWTSPMAGRWLRITPSNTAASSGDGVWYQISSVTNSTTIVLDKAYNGTSIGPAAGGAYNIGQMPILPEAYHDLPVYEAASVYFTTVQPEPVRAKMYMDRFEYIAKRMRADHGNKTSDPTIHAMRRNPINPNLVIWQT